MGPGADKGVSYTEYPPPIYRRGVSSQIKLALSLTTMIRSIRRLCRIPSTRLPQRAQSKNYRTKFSRNLPCDGQATMQPVLVSRTTPFTRHKTTESFMNGSRRLIPRDNLSAFLARVIHSTVSHGIWSEMLNCRLKFQMQARRSSRPHCESPARREPLMASWFSVLRVFQETILFQFNTKRR